MIRRLIILLLIVGCEEVLESIKEGCTTATACNYDATAMKDDGSCVAPQGCNEWCEGDSLSVQDLDCIGICGGTAIEDCAGACGGTAVLDDCGVCDGNGINQDSLHCGDLNVLQQFINNSQAGTNPPSYDLAPNELGSQQWENGRLIRFCSSGSPRNRCFTGYSLSGEIPTNIGDLNYLQDLHLYGNELEGIIPNSICNLNLDTISHSTSAFNNSTLSNNKLCPPYPECIINQSYTNTYWEVTKENIIEIQDTTNCP